MMRGVRRTLDKTDDHTLDASCTVATISLYCATHRRRKCLWRWISGAFVEMPKILGGNSKPNVVAEPIPSATHAPAIGPLLVIRGVGFTPITTAANHPILIELVENIAI